MEGHYSELNEVLEFREKVYEIQRNFMKRIGQGCLVSFGMNIPGPVKVNLQICRAYRLGQRKILETIYSMGVEILESSFVENRSGLASVYLLGSSNAVSIKYEMVKLEENHPLGRLYDVDVMGKDGLSISRIQLGIPLRRCLICGREAKGCARSRRHSAEDLQEKVSSILNQVIGGKEK